VLIVSHPPVRLSSGVSERMQDLGGPTTQKLLGFAHQALDNFTGRLDTLDETRVLANQQRAVLDVAFLTGTLKTSKELGPPLAYLTLAPQPRLDTQELAGTRLHHQTA
jgi:hypothetical protein